VPDLVRAGVPVGLGVDGTASNESGELGTELRNALLINRLHGRPDALTARGVLRLGTMGGARVLGRAHEIGSIEAGKLADLALWKIDGIMHSSIADPVAALTMGALPPLSLLVVNGNAVVENGLLTWADEDRIAVACARAARELAARA
jgi:cytosine/adenosine deaminase-related metal-dependent hydrolase